MKNKKQIVLSISHHLFLTRDQRYKLRERNELDVVGVSVPVWFERGNTSEPAEEIFSKYVLKNEPGDYFIINHDYGYEINLPQLPEDFKVEDLSNDDYRKMSQDERDEWYKKNSRPICGENLLDYKDAGGMSLKWTMVSNLLRGGKKLTIYNHVSIDDMTRLTDTLTFVNYE
tara:strand:- start:1879 stop:2394 length:516 start_codon:yes stop_codon:yes gene_type:complete